jgi:hypothetical protein|tara:strand:+ start:1696 stop:2580 length:885 start_codon:yes stop_codon:yes gene_type:complete
MASRLKGASRTAGDATRFGGQVPTFYLDPSNFTGSSLPISAGGTGGITLQTARDSLSVYSQTEIDTKVSTAVLGNANVIVNGTNNIAVDLTSLKFVLGGVQVGVWDNSTGIFAITGNVTVSGTIDGVTNVAAKALAASSWGNHADIGYLTSAPTYTILELGDVSNTSPTINQYLTWNGSEYSPVSFTISQFGINELNDVDTINFTPGVGNVLKWNGANWIADSDLSNAIQVLNDLNDVDTQSNAPSVHKVLAHTGAEWAPLDLDTILTEINLTTATIDTANLNDLSVDFGTISD